MPRVFDNLQADSQFLDALKETLQVSSRADFCVGYFNLRGWQSVDRYIEKWGGGEGHCCRLLVGMQRLPHEELRMAMSLLGNQQRLDNQMVLRIRKRLAEEFREQLTLGAPTNADEIGLRKLARQLEAKKVVVKLFLRHPLHAKLYLLFRSDPVNPITGYLGSSNLTLAGLSHQGELNVDVLDHDACRKLTAWFEDRWNDRWCVDISKELAEIIRESWAREELLPPYYVYVKMAYHLSREARLGLSEFRIPQDFGNKLLDFQTAAVKIAAHHLNKRRGVLIGDVVGLGKTLMATALARVFEDDQGLETLIICPKNLVPMWEDYRDQYRLRARVLSISQVTSRLPGMRRYRLVLIDESHHLRNREGRRYRAIQEYIRENDSMCILLSATPYNKTYLDLSGQLRLFVPEHDDLGMRPERLLRDIGETEFVRRHQAPVRSLAAFEQSPYADDWRDLMRLYLVRRTRNFIQENYAANDEGNGRKYLSFEDGGRFYFPRRVPKTLKFKVDDRYAQLFADDVVDAINGLKLPRYGLGKYQKPSPSPPPTGAEARILADLSHAGKRLMGFCRTNLFKRLESSGHSFLLSVERHTLRNYVFLHAIDNDLPLPIGTTDAGLLDTQSFDKDADEGVGDFFDAEDGEDSEGGNEAVALRSEADFRRRASEIYSFYTDRYKRRFRWLPARHFKTELAEDLDADATALLELLDRFGGWSAAGDAKLDALENLIKSEHAERKVLVFSQFADTVQYVESQLRERGVQRVAAVTGNVADPTHVAWRFSPNSNDRRKYVPVDEELRVLISTDVLSEGQNLQDCAIVVNYDLPWAIIRLIQRAGRVDRIGQQAPDILCYSFLPAEGIERLIRLRERVRTRLSENAEVVGTDEAFFEDEDAKAVVDLYNEKAGILDDEDESDVDMASYAYQIWRNATENDPSLKRKIESLPPVVHASKAHSPKTRQPAGVLVYMQTAQGYDALAWIDSDGNNVTQSQFDVLRAAACTPDTPALPRHDSHHEHVRSGVEHIAREEKQVGGQLGRPSGARFRTYERLRGHAENVKDTLFDTEQLRRAIDDIYRHPLRQAAIDTLNRQLRSGISDQALAELVLALRDEDRLSVVHEEDERQEPRLICSLGLIDGDGN